MADPKDTRIATPVIVDLGKVPKKQLKRLHEGRGKLLKEMRLTIEEVIQTLDEQVEGKEILPVILVYGRKRKKKKVVSLASFLSRDP